MLTVAGELRKELDSWIRASQTQDLYDRSIRRRLDGTCEWILESPAFTNWISPEFAPESAKTLWINGPAGYGKTVLCAKIVAHLSKTSSSPVASFFMSSDSESRRDPFSVARAWLSQAISCNPEAFGIVREKWEESTSSVATRAEIIETFHAVVSQVHNCIFIVDGLDECTWATGASGTLESPDEFFAAVQQSVLATRSRVLIVSRGEPEIR